MQREVDSYFPAIALACLLALFGIGASAQTRTFWRAPVTVSISPVSAILLTGGTQQFTATVTGSRNTAVTWSATGGTVSFSGLYTAPTTTGTYTVTATSEANSTKSASATVTVTVTAAPVVAVSIDPTSAPMLISGTQQFTAYITGTSNTAVTWSTTSGTVSTNGLYTAPATAGTYTVTATSVADTTKSASAAVTVTAPSPYTLAFVQHVSCPDSRNTGNAQSSSPVYTCPLPEPAQAGNTIVVGVKSYNTGSFSVSDDKSNTYGAAKGSVVDGNSAYLAIYVSTNVVGGTRTISFNQTSVNADFTEVSVSEYYNVTAVDTSHCSGWSSGSSSTISAGSLTPTVAGDLIWQYAINSGAGGASPNAVSSFSAGTSPSGISWQLLGTSLHDGDAVQAGVYNSTATITPQFTSGSSEDWSSCAVA